MTTKMIPIRTSSTSSADSDVQGVNNPARVSVPGGSRGRRRIFAGECRLRILQPLLRIVVVGINSQGLLIIGYPFLANFAGK